MDLRLWLAALLLLGAAGCLRNVPQHDHSGKDYRYKGAKKIELEDGEARVRDIVTYPGGDRVDWKVVELPEGQKGTLGIKLRWRPPRPGLDLAFNVYDEWLGRVERVKPSRGGKRSKRVKIKNVSGKYYIQIYAPRRTDAGRYTLSLRFRESKQAALPTAEEMAGLIDDPPVLPAVSPPKEKTPEELAAEEEARKQLEEQQRLEAEQRQQDEAARAELLKPIYARITRTQRSSSGVIITISAGKNREVKKGWVGTLLRGDSKSPLPGGGFKVIRVTRSESIARVQLSMDQVTANPRVELRRSSAGP